MGRPRKQRRQSHGSAWHWKQTDAWYDTLPGTKKRMPLFDEQGERIRGPENRQLAEYALARTKLADAMPKAGQAPADRDWLVARICSEYLQSCERRLAAGSMSRSHRSGAVAYLNDLCGYCGALPVAQLKTSHIQTWIEGHAGWRSSATHRSDIAVLLAAFNYAKDMATSQLPLAHRKAV